jgi:hypothetical protein
MNTKSFLVIPVVSVFFLGLLAGCASPKHPVAQSPKPPVSPEPPPAVVKTNRLVIHADQPGAEISRNIYGQFSEHLGHCIYGGLWVGEDSPIPNTRGIRNDVVAALKKIQVPVVRWPGGCFADEYHWMDGIGTPTNRPSMINTTWGGVVENNHFGTHEFMDFCGQIGAAPYICGNVGSGTVQEMMEWVEYLTSDADSPMANLRTAVESALLRRRQRKLGLRRQHDGGVLCRQFQPLQHLRERLPGQPHLPRRERRAGVRLPLDRSVDEAERERTETWGAGDERLFVALLHPAHQQLVAQGFRHQV